jgi:hypothetical protein
MPAARAAASREPPSSTSASASIRRAAAASRHRAASRRSPSEPSSCRVIAIVIRALPWVGVQSQTNRVTRNEAPSVTTRQEFGPLVLLISRGIPRHWTAMPLVLIQGLSDPACQAYSWEISKQLWR